MPEEDIKEQFSKIFKATSNFFKSMRSKALAECAGPAGDQLVRAAQATLCGSKAVAVLFLTAQKRCQGMFPHRSFFMENQSEKLSQNQASEK